jgi:intracellular multiplication protein IcmB
MLDIIKAAIGSFTKTHLSSFSRLETSAGEYALVADGGDLVTVLDLRGSRSLVSGKEIDRLAAQLAVKLGSFMDQPGFAMQFLFSCDPGRAKEELVRQLRPAASTAKNIGLDVGDILSERVKTLSTFIAAETSYVALWTRPSILSKDDRLRLKEKRKADRANLPPLDGKQDPTAGAQLLVQRHRIYVEAFVEALRACDFSAEILEVHAALGAIRDVVYPGRVDVKSLKRAAGNAYHDGVYRSEEFDKANTWRPYLPGDSFRWSSEKKDERPGDIMWPSLSSQIFHAGFDYANEDSDYVRIDGRIWASTDVTLGPTSSEGFQSLMNALIRSQDEDGQRVPFRISFLIETAGMGSAAVKQLFAKVLAFSSDSNRKLNEAMNGLRAMLARDADKAVSLRISAATWAPDGELDRLRGRLSALQQAIEQWGGMQTSAIAGDEVQGLMSSALGLDIASTAPRLIAPFREALGMLPWGRPAAPVDDGLLLFRYPDGKIFPHTPGKRSQMVVQLVFGPPGRGKSVLLNQLNMTTILSARSGSNGETELPRISIIDIGPSASGLISLIRESLPSQRRHEVVFHRLQNRPEDAINPFDTQLGCRKPTPLERSFLINFLTLIATPQDKEGRTYDGMIDLVSRVVDKVYKMRDPDNIGAPATQYSAGIEPEVDRLLLEHRVELPERPYWWEVVDRLHALGEIRGAEMAQKHAVPTLEMCTMAANDPQIKAQFENNRTPTTENIAEAFSRMVTSAIADMKILGSHTRIDFAGARIVALDIDLVAGKTSSVADSRKTAIAYMLARKALASDFYIGMDEVEQFPVAYRPYHATRIQKLREQPKRVHFDEFHRTSTALAVREQLILDIREGRKFGVEIVLASQMVEDFDQTMVDLATEVFILGAGSGDMGNRASDIFKLSDFARYHVNTQLIEPSAAGAYMVVKFALDNGVYEQFLMNTLGPVELWAFSTTPVDVELRRRLYDRIGPKAARTHLARRFRGGTAKKEIDRRQELLLRRGGMVKTEAEKGVIDEIVDEIVKANAENPVL